MAYSLYFITENLTVRRPKSVEFSRHGKAEVPIINVMKSVCSICQFNLTGGIPRTFDLIRIHAIGKVEARSNINIIEQGEVPAQRNTMLKPVTPIFYKV